MLTKLSSSPTPTALSASLVPSAPIGIFDSGVGGLSILKAIQQQLPNENLIYVADSAYAPYGDKSAEFIQQRSLQLTQFLLTHNIKALVVACNTATTEAISYLREQVTLPIVGVEPAIKPAAEQSKNNVIGILATHRTIKSDRLQELIDLYASGAVIIPQACPGLVEAIENNSSDQAQDIAQLIEQYTQTIRNENADTLILGCTHYPFIADKIQQAVGNHVTILETGKPVAIQLGRILKKNGIENTTAVSTSTTGGKITFYSSMDSQQHRATIGKLWNTSISVLPLPSSLPAALSRISI